MTHELPPLVAAMGAFIAAIACAIRVHAAVRLRRAELDKIEVELASRVFEDWEIDRLLPDKLRSYSVETAQSAPERWILTDDGEIMEVRDAI